MIVAGKILLTIFILAGILGFYDFMWKDGKDGKKYFWIGTFLLSCVGFYIWFFA